jgi:cardiolipin synthase
MRRHIERGILDAVLIGTEDIAKFGWARRFCYGFAYRIYKLMMRLFAIGYA